MTEGGHYSLLKNGILKMRNKLKQSCKFVVGIMNFYKIEKIINVHLICPELACLSNLERGYYLKE